MFLYCFGARSYRRGDGPNVSWIVEIFPISRRKRRCCRCVWFGVQWHDVTVALLRASCELMMSWRQECWPSSGFLCVLMKQRSGLTGDWKSSHTGNAPSPALANWAPSRRRRGNHSSKGPRSPAVLPGKGRFLFWTGNLMKIFVRERQLFPETRPAGPWQTWSRVSQVWSN